jgi:hypothetical protein
MNPWFFSSNYAKINSSVIHHLCSSFVISFTEMKETVMDLLGTQGGTREAEVGTHL